MNQLFCHGTFCGTNHGNSWYPVCYNRCKSSDPFQISYCIEHIYSVYDMKRVQTYLYLLTPLDPVLDTLPTYTYLVLLYI